MKTIIIIFCVCLFSVDSFAQDRTARDSAKTLDEVIFIEAGNFAANEKATGAALTPIDAVTVAGNGGDIANALRALPGPQQIGDREGLFVRGGSSAESRQFIDGVQLRNPNYSSVPGFPQPARLNPFLFKGILFSSGGYSALYGQAMSAALVLESADLPDQSAASFSLFPMQVSGGFQQLADNKRGSYGATARYSHHRLYNNLINVQRDFFAGPEYISGDANFRVRTGKKGMFKFYTNYGRNRVGVNDPDPNRPGSKSPFEVQGDNLFTTVSYSGELGKRWEINSAVAHNYYSAKKAREGVKETDRSDFAQAKMVISRSLRRKQALRFGASYIYSRDIHVPEVGRHQFTDNILAVFAEADIFIARDLSARAGLRSETSTLTGRTGVAPRLSVAYRLPDRSQFNMAYGQFYQQPEREFVFTNRSLDAPRADHFIINYQRKGGNRFFRAEAYYKKYRDLVTLTPETDNGGDGYAKGFEVFFRDKRTVRNLDYWVTYSFLDTKRQHLDYPQRLQPEFATPHTFSVAVKRFFESLSLNINLAYTIATGRPYYNFKQAGNGNTMVADQGITNNYSGLNLSFAYLFSMFPNAKNRDFSGIGIGVNNLFARQQVFGYRYSQDGNHREPILLPAVRTFYFGIFMSLGTDRTQDILDENF